MQTKEEFLLWEKRSRDTIDFKKIYADVAGDVLAGLLLSQIVYWHLPTAKGVTKITTTYNDKEYLVKQAKNWWDEIRLTIGQYKGAIKILQNKGIITIEAHKSMFYQGVRASYIWLNFEVLIKLIEDSEKNPVKAYPKRQKLSAAFASKSSPQLFEKLPTAFRNGAESISLYTETTTKTTTKKKEEKEEGAKAPFLLETSPEAATDEKQKRLETFNTKTGKIEIPNLPDGLELLRQMEAYSVSSRGKAIQSLLDTYPVDLIQKALAAIKEKGNDFNITYLRNAIKKITEEGPVMDSNVHSDFKQFCLDYFRRESDALDVIAFYRKLSQKQNKKLKTKGSEGKNFTARKITNVKYLVETFGEQAFLKAIKKFSEEDKAGTFKDYTLQYVTNRINYEFENFIKKKSSSTTAKESAAPPLRTYVIPTQDHNEYGDYYKGKDASCNWFYKCSCGEIVDRFTKECSKCTAQFEWEKITFVDTVA